jgi:hypothetical protein
LLHHHDRAERAHGFLPLALEVNGKAAVRTSAKHAHDQHGRSGFAVNNASCGL